MTHDELTKGLRALLAVLKIHKPYDESDAPFPFVVGWCKGCSIEYNKDEYASQRYPCPTIQDIEKELL
jgi:hypothetical protein